MNRYSSRRSLFSFFAGPVTVWLAVIAINATLGGFCLNYILGSVAGKSIPWFPAGVVGLILGELTIPGALICWVLRLVGLHAPFIH